ncbi:MAG: outer membrane protein assembly factor BamB [Aeromicrobium sp.]|nr:outer membrane protein assembly factor BamB [Burkholderiales bacterium]
MAHSSLHGSRGPRAVAGVAMLLLVGGLSGCASVQSWMPSAPSMRWLPSWAGGDKKLAPLAEIRDSAISVQWTANAGSPKLFMFSPSVSDKVIFTAAHDGTINAIEEQGGKSIARIDAKAKLTGGIGAAENIVVVADTRGQVLAFDAAGRSLWKTPLDGEILAAPVVSQSTIVVRTADGRMFALNRTDGKRRWVFTRATPPLTLRTGAGVAINRGIIYAGFPAGKVVAVELESGRPVWEATISLPRGSTELERVADVAGVPVLDDTRVCAAVYQGRTGCVETLNGNALWTRDISSSDGVAVDAKNLYVADTDGNMNALDKTSGSTVWKQDKLVKRDLGTPIIVKGRILVGDRVGFVHAIAPDSGELVGRVATDGSRVLSLVVNGDRAIAQTERGGVFAIAVR